MTATQQFIEDAIEGGWNHKLKRNGYYSIFIDWRAWQAVGKTRGWAMPEVQYRVHSDRHSNTFTASTLRWVNEWHVFIDHLAEGKTIEEALKAIS